MPIDGMHLGSVVAAVHLSLGFAAARAWLCRSFARGMVKEPSVTNGEVLEGRQNVKKTGDLNWSF